MYYITLYNVNVILYCMILYYSILYYIRTASACELRGLERKPDPAWPPPGRQRRGRLRKKVLGASGFGPAQPSSGLASPWFSLPSSSLHHTSAQFQLRFTKGAPSSGECEHRRPGLQERQAPRGRHLRRDPEALRGHEGLSWHPRVDRAVPCGACSQPRVASPAATIGSSLQGASLLQRYLSNACVVRKRRRM